MHLRQQRAGGHGGDDLSRQPPTELLGHLVAQRLGALGVVGPDVDVDERRLFEFVGLGQLAAEPVDVVVGTFDTHQGAAVDRRLDDLGRLQVGRNEDDGVHPDPRRVGRDRVGQVAGGRAGDPGETQLPGCRDRHRHNTILERVRRIGRVVLDPQGRRKAQLGPEAVGPDERGHPGTGVDPALGILTYREQARVPPEGVGAGLDLRKGHRRQGRRVITDLEGAETFEAGVLWTERVPSAAVAAHQGTGRGRRGGAFDQSSHGTGSPSPHLSLVALRQSRSWHLSPPLTSRGS